MINVESFFKHYRNISSKNKKIKIFNGTHGIERPNCVFKESIEFIISCFSKKNQFSKKLSKESDKSN